MTDCEIQKQRYVRVLFDIKTSKLDLAEWFLQNGLFCWGDPSAISPYDQYLEKTKDLEEKWRLIGSGPRCEICDKYHTVPEGF